MKRSFIAITSISALLMLALLALGGCGDSSGSAYTLPPQPTPAPTQPASSGLPSDIPIYPGAQLVGNPSTNQATFQAPADQETISKFYQQQMPQQGWKTGQIQDNGADGIFLTFTKDARTLHVTITPGNTTNQSTLLITVGNN
jgi:hypothetical protein